MAESIVILVTGANRGLGYEYVRSLAAYFHHPSHSVGKSFTYLVGGRDKDNIQEAIKSLQTALGDEGVKDTNLQGVLIDITNDSSIQSAVEDVRQRFNGLDVLINNAGIAKVPPSALEAARETYHQILDTNIASVANSITAFAPLLQLRGRRGLVVNISSGRGSITRLTDPKSAKTVSVPYSVSKVALNGLTLEMAKVFDGIEFQVVNPGHCATALNNFMGKRDPREGATAAVLLVQRWLNERSECGFWETVGSSWELSRVPW